jgi:hypothetical protein
MPHASAREPRQRGAQPSFLSLGQSRQQEQQQQLLQQQHYRQQQLRVPFWVRQLASQLLQVLTSVDPVASQTGSSAADPAGLPEEVQQQLISLLPAYQPTPAQQLRQAQADEESNAEAAAAAAVEGGQQQGQQLQAAEQGVAPLPAVEPAPAAAPAEGQQGEEEEAAASKATAGVPGDVFADELANILNHYQSSAAGEGEVEGGGSEDEASVEVETSSATMLVAAAATTSSSSGSSATASDDQQAGTGDSDSSSSTSSSEFRRRMRAAAAAAPVAPAFASGRVRRLDEGGFMLLLRAMAIMVNGSSRSAGAIATCAATAHAAAASGLSTSARPEHAFSGPPLTATFSGLLTLPFAGDWHQERPGAAAGCRLLGTALSHPHSIHHRWHAAPGKQPAGCEMAPLKRSRQRMCPCCQRVAAAIAVALLGSPLHHTSS